MSAEDGGAYAERLADLEGAAVVRLVGDVDLNSLPDIAPTIEKAADDFPVRLVVDMSGITFMDSSGLALLVGVAERVETVVLTGVSSSVRRIIELTGLSETFHLEG